ncbi:hypothetical protein Bca52824_026773 [Brassica carinata]|uniref:Uncharacterized protein n=1 Tax=Brassica carinata TaxID=52824 RepID=A0A8X7SIA7_BRACI|nr:hypothetical protein Bca52824_026773 [Brassica carinata]
MYKVQTIALEAKHTKEIEVCRMEAKLELVEDLIHLEALKVEKAKPEQRRVGSRFFSGVVERQIVVSIAIVCAGESHYHGGAIGLFLFTPEVDLADCVSEVVAAMAGRFLFFSGVVERQIVISIAIVCSGESHFHGGVLYGSSVAICGSSTLRSFSARLPILYSVEGFVFLVEVVPQFLTVLNWTLSTPESIASNSDNCPLVLGGFKCCGGSRSLIVAVSHLVYAHIPASYQFT